MRTWALVIVVVAALATIPSRPAAQTPPNTSSSPALVVVLVVDQMRADYLTTFASRWQGGFRQILDRGARFDEARYPYWSTITCAGHATIGTGTLPRTHGMVLNRWWDRDARRVVACTDDAASPVVSYGGRPVAGGHSGMRLLRTTLADEIRTQQPGARVVTVSLKPRSAIGLAGHGGDAVTWFDEITGAFVTSKAFTAARIPEVAAALEPLERQLNAVWMLAAPPESYRFGDLLPGERPDRGWTALFPHPLAGRTTGVDADVIDHWQKTPLADEQLARVATSLVDAWRLGQRGVTDFLGVSFSTLDMVGHDFGPRSREVEDILIRLDRTIGALMMHLDRTVGRDRYVLALTADHGVAAIPETAGGGRVANEDIGALVETTLTQLWGRPASGTYVDATLGGHVYLGPNISTRVHSSAEARDALERAVRRVPGLARIVWSDRLDAADAVTRAVASGYRRERSGDFMVVPQAGWITELRADADATTHGTMYDYDSRVPLILVGAPIVPGRHRSASSPADIAPTLAKVAGIRFADRDGRVLAEALR